MTLASIIEKVIAETTLTADLEGFYREPLVGYSSPSDPRYLEIARITGWPCLHPLEMMAEAKTVVSFFYPVFLQGSRSQSPFRAGGRSLGSLLSAFEPVDC